MKLLLPVLFALACGASEPTASEPTEPVDPEPVGSIEETPPAETEDDDDAYAADLETLCNRSIRDNPEIADATREEQAMMLAVYIDENVHTGRMRELARRMSALVPAERDALVLGEAERHGLTECLLVDFWQSLE